jgi:FKBP-type peptidyl-prolyl cis-trans isomerase SlyD
MLAARGLLDKRALPSRFHLQRRFLVFFFDKCGNSSYGAPQTKPQKGSRVSKKVISFHYLLTDASGKTLDSSAGGEPLTFLEGVGQIIPGLETELRGMKVGEKKHVIVKAKDGYGEKDPGNVVEVPLEKMPTRGIKAGDRFRAGQDSNSPVVTVANVTETYVTLDGNHPLAGMDLTFDVEIAEVRDATEDELTHGHAHGPGEHHH